MYCITLKLRKVKKSRKEKSCTWCGFKIRISMPKVCSSTIYEGDFQYAHMHPECDEALHLLSSIEKHGFEYDFGDFHRGSIYSSSEYNNQAQMPTLIHKIPYHQIYKNSIFAQHYDQLLDDLYDTLSNMSERFAAFDAKEQYKEALQLLQVRYEDEGKQYWDVSPTPEDRETIIKMITGLQSV